MGVPYMGYAPDGMMGPIAMPMGGMAPSLPAPGGGSGCPAGGSAQRNDLVTKAKAQQLWWKCGWWWRMEMWQGFFEHLKRKNKKDIYIYIIHIHWDEMMESELGTSNFLRCLPCHWSMAEPFERSNFSSFLPWFQKIWALASCYPNMAMELAAMFLERNINPYFFLVFHCWKLRNFQSNSGPRWDWGSNTTSVRRTWWRMCTCGRMSFGAVKKTSGGVRRGGGVSGCVFSCLWMFRLHDAC